MLLHFVLCMCVYDCVCVCGVCVCFYVLMVVLLLFIFRFWRFFCLYLRVQQKKELIDIHLSPLCSKVWSFLFLKFETLCFVYLSTVESCLMS